MSKYLVFAGVAFAITSATTSAHIPASCVGPAMPGHSAPRIASGVSVTGTNGANGIGRGDIYTCHNGIVSVH